MYLFLSPYFYTVFNLNPSTYKDKFGLLTRETTPISKKYKYYNENTSFQIIINNSVQKNFINLEYSEFYY